MTNGGYGCSNESRQRPTTLSKGPEVLFLVALATRLQVPVVLPFLGITRLARNYFIIIAAPAAVSSLSPTLDQSLCPAPSSRIIGDTRSLAHLGIINDVQCSVSAGSRLSCIIGLVGATFFHLAGSRNQQSELPQYGGKQSSPLLSASLLQSAMLARSLDDQGF